MKLSEAVFALKSAGIEDARREARIIFSHFAKIPISDLLVLDVDVHSAEVSAAIVRRAKREPLQYIIGEVGFFNEVYKVSPACLIPRSDTEILVEYAVSHLKGGSRFLDICTGSGCIAISTLRNSTDTTAVAIDLSQDALAIAKENAKRMNVEDRVEFLECDALEENAVSNLGVFDAILSNPPYVSEREYKGLEPEIFYEPRMAFVGGDDGGEFYRALTPIYKKLLSDDGFIAFEIGYNSEPILRHVAEVNAMSLDIIRDLSGNVRVAVLKNKISI